MKRKILEMKIVSWKDIISAYLPAEIIMDTAVSEKYAAHLNELFDVIAPNRISDAYSRAVSDGDYAAAVHILADYYRAKPAVSVDYLAAIGSSYPDAADRAVNGYMCEVSREWHFENGDINFLFDPTELEGPRNHEWLWQLNRHSWWKTLANTYTATKNEIYAYAFRKQLLAWIAQTDVPEHWNAPGSAWRTIECGIRLLGSWQVAFDGFRHSEGLDDLSLLLMIASMHRQACHLIAHPTQKNWLMMEANGVYTFSALFDELSDSAEHRRIAAGWLLRETGSQILPDGMHNELSPDYQNVVFGCAADFYSLAQALGYENEVSEDLADAIRATVDAAIALTTPALTQPRTNDCYTIALQRFTDGASAVLGDTPEYRYFNTKRAEGTPPAGEQPSRYLPYAGFAAMRSGWDADAAYLCFDVGPLGLAHIHQDMLNINLWRGDEELLYDDGGGQYEVSEARGYALSSFAHNTVSVDGLPQSRTAPYQYDTPYDAHWISCADFDYAQGLYDDVFGQAKPASHMRQIRFCKPGFFVVNDILTSTDGGEHTYEVLFHTDTTRVHQTDVYPGAVITDFGRKYDLLMIPMDESGVSVETHIVSAQTTPRMRGWYNGRNDRDLHPATTVSRTVSGVKDFRFTTLLIPVCAGDPMPEITVTADRTVHVMLEGRSYAFDLNALDR